MFEDVVTVLAMGFQVGDDRTGELIGGRTRFCVFFRLMQRWGRPLLSLLREKLDISAWNGH